MTKKLWKSYTFLILSVLVTFAYIAFFLVGFGTDNQTLLTVVYYLIFILGIASLIMGIWSFMSKLALQKTTIFASLLTLANLFIFSFLF